MFARPSVRQTRSTTLKQRKMNTDKVAGGDKTTNGGDGNLTNMIGKLLLEVREEGKRLPKRLPNIEIRHDTDLLECTSVRV